MLFAIVIILPLWLWLVVFAVIAVAAVAFGLASHASNTATEKRNAELQRPKGPDEAPASSREDW